MLLNFHDAFVGKIDIENRNKFTPLNGASLFCKKEKKNAWSTIVPDYYLVLFSFAYVSREIGTKK